MNIRIDVSPLKQNIGYFRSLRLGSQFGRRTAALAVLTSAKAYVVRKTPNGHGGYTCEVLGVMFAVVISGYTESKMSQWHLAKWIKCRVKRTLPWVKQNVAPGFRFVLGLLLVCGGIFGVLPVLGFWMIPLGIAVAALDIRPFSQVLARQLNRLRK
ncbi:MAG: hypothetical protein OEU36_20405 [Gammaproteobacteria bacterium]|nr:hypothetical protein [Gammaproteobacteria bacterium]